MGRPDMKTATVLDTGGQDAESKGGAHGTEDTAVEETNDAFNEPGGEPDADGGAEDQKTGEISGEEEGEVSGETEGTESGESAGVPEIDQLRDEINQLKETLEAREEAPAEQPPAPQLTEEDWARKEAEFGVPRNAIQAFTSQSIKVYNQLRQEMEGRFAKFEKAESMRALSREKGFSDIHRYEKEIDKYLSHYAPQHHSNAEVLKRAYFYSRGLNMNKQIQTVRNESEKNRKIGGPGRPAPAGAAMRKGGGNAPSLSPTQRSAAKAFGMSESEYAKLNNGSNKIG